MKIKPFIQELEETFNVDCVFSSGYDDFCRIILENGGFNIDIRLYRKEGQITHYFEAYCDTFATRNLNIDECNKIDNFIRNYLKEEEM